jgi:cell volume regulation protein A
VIIDVVFFVVLTSVLLQGTTMVTLVRKLGMASTRPAWRSVAEVLPLTDSEFDLAEIEVPPDLHIVGRPLSEAGTPEGVRVLAVVRDHRVMIPTGDSVIAAGDMLVLAVDRDAARTLDLADWIQSACVAHPDRADPAER